MNSKRLNNKMRIEEDIDPLNLDWEYFWQKGLLKYPRQEKDWNKIANTYEKWIENDDYPEKLINQIRVTEEDTILDLGCGEGSITIPLAKKAKSVTAIDRADLMLDKLKEKALKEDLKNINTINQNIEDINTDKIKSHDIIVASRSLGGLFQIKKTLIELNNIANKYVYITLFGSSNNQYKKEKASILGKNVELGPDYIYLPLILKSIGIEANIINLECENLKEYNSIEEAIDRAMWKLGIVSDEEQAKLDSYFRKKFIKNKSGKWINPHDKVDWVLIWWKVAND